MTNPSRSMISPTTTSRPGGKPGSSDDERVEFTVLTTRVDAKQEDLAVAARRTSGGEFRRGLRRIDAGDDGAQGVREHVGGQLGGGSVPQGPGKVDLAVTGAAGGRDWGVG